MIITIKTVIFNRTYIELLAIYQPWVYINILFFFKPRLQRDFSYPCDIFFSLTPTLEYCFIHTMHQSQYYHIPPHMGKHNQNPNLEMWGNIWGLRFSQQAVIFYDGNTFFWYFIMSCFDIQCNIEALYHPVPPTALARKEGE